MPSNSIFDKLSKDDIINDINMSLTADFKHEHVFLIVEGDTDIAFFNNRIKNNVNIYQSYSGKLGVYEIVSFFLNSRVIGICDSDYDEIQHDNIFNYDYNSLEMMLVADDLAFSTVFYLYYDRCINFKSYREKYMRDLLRVSLYRKLNTNNGWGLNFEGVSCDKLFDVTQNIISSELVDNEIRRENPNFVNALITEYITQINAVDTSGYSLSDLLNITRGHDFLKYFNFMLRRNGIKKLPSEDDLLKLLSCAYNLDSFKSSCLYRSLLILNIFN